MANDLAKRLMACVRGRREALGLSQEAFAERAGLKYKHYQAVEAGRKIDIRLSTLEKLSKACGLELRELFNFGSAPMALAEDPEDNDSPATASRRARKPPKRRIGQKGGRTPPPEDPH